MTTAFAARYDVTTHATSSTPAESEPCRCGSTTLVTLVSMICITVTSMTEMVIAQRWPGESGSSVTGRGS
jgi:hypothetical protein